MLNSVTCPRWRMPSCLCVGWHWAISAIISSCAEALFSPHVISRHTFWAPCISFLSCRTVVLKQGRQGCKWDYLQYVRNQAECKWDTYWSFKLGIAQGAQHKPSSSMWRMCSFLPCFIMAWFALQPPLQPPVWGHCGYFTGSTIQRGLKTQQGWAWPAKIISFPIKVS